MNNTFESKTIVLFIFVKMRTDVLMFVMVLLLNMTLGKYLISGVYLFRLRRTVKLLHVFMKVY